MYEPTTGNLKCLHHFDVRVLSLAWHTDNVHLFVGGADGIIRKVSIDSGCSVLEMVLDSSKKTIVWELKYLEPFVISADSGGRITIWHDTFGTIHQSFSEHSADVLALAVDCKGTIYSSGVDRKISCFKKVAGKNEWARAGDVTVHSNDVRTLDVSSLSGFLASGGVDGDLIFCDRKKFKNSHCRVYSQFQDSSRFFSVADKASVVMHQTKSSVQLWQFSEENKMPVHILEISAKGTHHVLSSAISSDATKLSVSTVKHLWLYDLNLKDLKWSCVLSLKLPSYQQVFCCDSNTLILASIQEGLKVLDLQTNQWATHSNFPHITDVLGRSEDSHVLVVDIFKQMYICDVKSGVSVVKLPVLDLRPLDFFAFGATDFVVCCANQIYSYNLSTSQLTKLNDMKKGIKGFCLTNSNGLAAYDGKTLSVGCLGDHFVKFKQVFSMKSNDLATDSSIIFVSAFNTNKLVMVENLLCDTLNCSSHAFFKDRYAT